MQYASSIQITGVLFFVLPIISWYHFNYHSTNQKFITQIRIRCNILRFLGLVYWWDVFVFLGLQKSLVFKSKDIFNVMVVKVVVNFFVFSFTKYKIQNTPVKKLTRNVLISKLSWRKEFYANICIKTSKIWVKSKIIT